MFRATFKVPYPGDEKSKVFALEIVQSDVSKNLMQELHSPGYKSVIGYREGFYQDDIKGLTAFAEYDHKYIKDDIQNVRALKSNRQEPKRSRWFRLKQLLKGC